jgi:hypothetical protein
MLDKPHEVCWICDK